MLSFLFVKDKIILQIDIFVMKFKVVLCFATLYVSFLLLLLFFLAEGKSLPTVDILICRESPNFKSAKACSNHSPCKKKCNFAISVFFKLIRVISCRDFLVFFYMRY